MLHVARAPSRSLASTAAVAGMVAPVGYGLLWRG